MEYLLFISSYFFILTSFYGFQVYLKKKRNKINQLMTHGNCNLHNLSTVSAKHAVNITSYHSVYYKNIIKKYNINV